MYTISGKIKSTECLALRTRSGGLIKEFLKASQLFPSLVPRPLFGLGTRLSYSLILETYNYSSRSGIQIIVT